MLTFLQGVDTEPSSKRLLGVVTGLTFCLLCLAGGIVELREKAFNDFENILIIIGGYSAGLLGVSVFERRTKAKYNIVTTEPTPEPRDVKEEKDKQEVTNAS